MKDPWENIQFQGLCSTPLRKCHDHPSIDVYLMDWKMPGPLRLKIFVIGETMLIPKYFIPFVFHIKGGYIRSCLNVFELSGIASLLFQLILYPEKLPNELIKNCYGDTWLVRRILSAYIFNLKSCP